MPDRSHLGRGVVDESVMGVPPGTMGGRHHRRGEIDSPGILAQEWAPLRPGSLAGPTAEQTPGEPSPEAGVKPEMHSASPRGARSWKILEGMTMANNMGVPSQHGLEHHGLTNLNTIYWTLPSPTLVETVVQRREGQLAHLGPVIVRTGHHTGRSPNDKFVVQSPGNGSEIWWGKLNRPMTPEQFDRLHLRMRSYFQGRDVFVQDAGVGANPAYRFPLRILTDYAWPRL